MIEQFKQRYDKDPSSKAFAPLCEAYRKAGQHDEAIKILKKSIKNILSMSLVLSFLPGVM